MNFRSRLLTGTCSLSADMSDLHTSRSTLAVHNYSCASGIICLQKGYNCEWRALGMRLAATRGNASSSSGMRSHWT